MANTVTTSFKFEEKGKGLDQIIKNLAKTETTAKDVADAISAMADEIRAETERAAVTSEKLSDALGPEFVASLDRGEQGITEMVDKLRRMGLTFEDIEANADELAASLRKFEDVKLDVANTGLSDTRARALDAKGGVDELTDSSRGANSALANMIGNSAQDLGAFTGIAGSAGVAIGQMAEYASDATLAGEGLSSSLKSMALVAGPIAALTIGVEILGRVLHKNKEEQEAIRKAIDETVDALARAREEGKSFADVLDELATTKARDAMSQLGEKSDETVDALDAMGVTWEDVIRAFRSGDGPLAAVLDRFSRIDKTTFDMRNSSALARDEWENMARAAGVSTDEFESQYVAMSQLNDAFGMQVDVQRKANAESEAAANFMDRSAQAAEDQATAVQGGNAAFDIYADNLKNAAKASDAASAATERQRRAHLLNASAINQETDALLDSLDTLYDYESAALDTADAVEAMTAAQNDSEAAADDVRRAQIDAAQAALSQAQAFSQSKGAIDGSTLSAQLQLAELNRLAAKFPELSTFIQDYINKLKAIPSVAKTQLVITSTGAVTTKQTANQFGRLVAGAEGAIVTRPTGALIGEAGPEAVIPLNKMPGASPLPGGAGAGDVVIHATIYANDSESVFDKLAREVRMKGAGPIRRALGID